ncbi:MAG: UDP-3-O-[3-hydroxymyristoyl] glucosamine N-acyltransferase [Sphingobacteriales bacterium]|jgi:UDP-3-O-[3-hydroxymyristoyl] glucosamine N-acyltransferase
MEFTVKQIAELLGGTIIGNEKATVNHLAKIEEGERGSLSFLANPKYEEFIYSTKASVVIVNDSFVPEKEIKATLIKVDDAYSSFSEILNKYNQLYRKTGIETPSNIGEGTTVGDDIYIGAFAYIGSNCKIGKNVQIYPNAFIGDNVKIGDNCIISSGVSLYHETIVGADCILHSGVVLGSDGFGFAPKADGTYDKISQIGNVIIEDNVEIGANTTIDRATMGSTIIRKGVKLDNLIQIAHNVEIGENTVIAAQAGISGSTKIGKNCVIGGQVGIVGHIVIADGTKINAQSGISKSITEENQPWNGSPATNFRDSMRSQAVYRRLPDLEKRLVELEQIITELKNTSV